MLLRTRDYAPILAALSNPAPSPEIRDAPPKTANPEEIRNPAPIINHPKPPGRIIRAVNTHRYRARIASLVRKHVKNEIDTILRETYLDYRAQQILKPSGSLLIAMTLALPVAIYLMWKSNAITGAIVILLIMLSIVLLGWYQISRTRKARLFSDRLSVRLQQIVRMRRIDRDTFKFIIRTRSSEIINAQEGTYEIFDNLSPVITAASHTNDILNPTAAWSDIRDRVLARGSFVLGVSGSRGIGKTTTLNYLKRFEAEVGEVILLRLPSSDLENDLARYVLDALVEKLAQDSEPLSVRKRGKVTRVIGGLGAISIASSFVLMGLASYAFDTPLFEAEFRQPIGSLLGAMPATSISIFVVFLTVIGYVMILLAAIRSFSPLSSSNRIEYVREMAKDVRERLRFEQEVTHRAEAGLILTPGKGLLSRERRTRARPLSYGDVYASFEALVERYRHVTGKHILLLIDELDRYEPAANDEVGKLGKALNQLKPIFLIPGVSAVLTISTQAAESFHRRDPGSLGVLDSTFDEVVTLREWDPKELRILLSNLVVGLSKPTQVVLSELADGRPREAVRLGWMMCQLMDGTTPMELSSIVSAKAAVTDKKRTQSDCLNILTSYRREARSTNNEKRPKTAWMSHFIAWF